MNSLMWAMYPYQTCLRRDNISRNANRLMVKLLPKAPNLGKLGMDP